MSESTHTSPNAEVGSIKPEDPTTAVLEHRGIEPVPEADRTGSPWSLFTVWMGANSQFATLTTGVLATAVFGLSFWQALAAITLGTTLGAATLAAFSLGGPRLGVPQMVQSRRAFGYVGNFAPATLNAFSALSYFAVNTILGVFALQVLLGISFGLGLVGLVIVQTLIAVVGHHLIHTVERWLSLLLIALFIALSIYGFGHGHTATGSNARAIHAVGGFSGAFILMTSISFSYAIGWVAYASDYSRYLPRTIKAWRVWVPAGMAMLLAGVWIESLGAAFGTAEAIDQPAQLVHGLVPHSLGQITMVGIVLGAITANVITIYSGTLSALVLNLRLERWIVAVILSATGTVIAWFAGQGGFYRNYENFVFLVGYWLTPWIAIAGIDLLNDWRARTAAPSMDAFFDRRCRLRRGFVIWLISIAVSVPFWNQSLYRGPIATRIPALGDITYFVGLLVAAALYTLARTPIRPVSKR
ncbi:MAG: purine-cytosine permease family protein [Actinoallomurus sp.]